MSKVEENKCEGQKVARLVSSNLRILKLYQDQPCLEVVS